MTPPTEQEARKAIEALGWVPESHDFSIQTDNPLMAYRATQRQFKTLWLMSWSEVLAWIQGRKDEKK